MGLFSKIKKGLKKLILVSGNSGRVTGGDYVGYGVSCVVKSVFESDKSYVGQKIPCDAVVMACLGKENVIFGKKDIQSFEMIQSNARWTHGNQPKIGNRYKIVFLDGKSSIINIVANGTSEFEAIFI